MDTSQLLINFLLFALLPIWIIAGFIDWLCHRATHIESTSGLKESLIHSLMGIQIAVPMLLCLLYEVNVLVMLICLLAWLLHEAVAHWDIYYASSKRKINIWEMHAHSYLATLPMYMLASIIIINWPVFLQLISFDWQGQMQLMRLEKPHGGEGYLPTYLGFMTLVGVLPYFEENLRCLHYWLKHRNTTHTTALK